jgi:hypothetical protein
MSTAANNGKKKVKGWRVFAVVLMVIGGLTVIDNGIRLGREIVNTVTHHQWNLVVIK